mmetsp:Transcript_19310/g.45710  ORF Transcript_19310/g.45710 Transcript_19310/m.45710 type:complete len:115 (-) Transcript_19310:60-404(-)
MSSGLKQTTRVADVFFARRIHSALHRRSWILSGGHGVVDCCWSAFQIPPRLTRSKHCCTCMLWIPALQMKANRSESKRRRQALLSDHEKLNLREVDWLRLLQDFGSPDLGESSS